MDDIENWYEKILFEKIAHYQRAQLQQANPDYDTTLWSDVACLALNHLPPRYVRHSVDMRFYLSPQEQQEMDQRVEDALQNAMAYVKQHPNPYQQDAATPVTTLN